MATSDHKNATISHEMRFDRQKLGKNCAFELPRATLMQEMRFDRQTLWKGCDFDGPAAILMREMKFDRQKLECKSVCVTSSHLTSSPSFLSVPDSLPTTLSPSYGRTLSIFIFLLSFCIGTHVSMPLFSFHLKIAYIPLSLSFLLLTPTPHTSYILITLCVYLHLSNLLLYALGLSVV